MSRIAEALHKSRGESTQAGPLNAASGLTGIDSSVESSDPWDVMEAAPPPAHVPDIPSRAVRDVLPPEAPAAASTSRDELTRLVQRIFRPVAGTKGVRAVLFSTVGEQADSTTLCAWAARALAEQTSESVCVVDSNLQMPTPHSARGRSDALLDLDPAAAVGSLATRIDRNLWLPAAGSRTAAASPHVVAEQLRVRMPQLLATFEYVLVDAPAGAQTDLSVLGPLVDGVVLIVEANTTRRDAAKRVAGQLQATNVRVLGVVLTNRTFPIPEAIYRRL